MCELGLSGSHTIPSTTPSVLTCTAEVVLVSCPEWFKNSHEMNSRSNRVMLMDGFSTVSP